MTLPATRRWAVIWRARGRGRQELWLVVTGVPSSVRAAEVMAAIEAAAWWPAWQRRIGMGETVRVVSERSWPEWVLPSAPSSGVRTWAELAPETRRLSIPLGSDVHALVRRAAAAAGQPVQTWAADALEAAATYVDMARSEQVAESPKPQTRKTTKRRVSETTKRQTEEGTSG